MKTEMRYCEDIDMWAIDRQISGSCIFKTTTCEKECFNDKLYKLYPAMHGKDIRNEAYWDQITGIDFKSDYARKKKGKTSNRFRMMTRGETFDSVEGVHKMHDLALQNQDLIFWIPTRAWRDVVINDNNEILSAVMSLIVPLKNCRVLASMDDSNTEEEWLFVTRVLRLSTMHFDADKAPQDTLAGDRFFRCPKTHKHLNGHCSICKAGCFNNKKRVDVHLLKH